MLKHSLSLCAFCARANDGPEVMNRNEQRGRSVTRLGDF